MIIVREGEYGPVFTHKPVCCYASTVSHLCVSSRRRHTSSALVTAVQRVLFRSRLPLVHAGGHHARFPSLRRRKRRSLRGTHPGVRSGHAPYFALTDRKRVV